jgi:hypothetical protein
VVRRPIDPVDAVAVVELHGPAGRILGEEEGPSVTVWLRGLAPSPSKDSYY